MMSRILKELDKAQMKRIIDLSFVEISDRLLA